MAATYEKSFEFVQVVSQTYMTVITINSKGEDTISKETTLTEKTQEIQLSNRPTLIAYPTAANLRHFNYVHNGFTDDDNRAKEARATWKEENERAKTRACGLTPRTCPRAQRPAARPSSRWAACRPEGARTRGPPSRRASS